MIILIKIGLCIYGIIYAFMKLFPVRDKVVFLSRQGDAPSVDFKMLSEEIKAEHPEYRIVMLCKKLRKTPAGIIGYIFHLIRQAWQIATARVALLDSYCIPISCLHHRDSLLVIQMWHSVGTMKKFGRSILDQPEGSSSRVANAMHMHEGYDYVLSAGDAYIPHLASGFGVDESKIVTLPLPRVERLKDHEYKEETRTKIFSAYPELNNGKINICYAPTFRKDESERQVFSDALKRLINAIDGDRFNLILKLHPLDKHVASAGSTSDSITVSQSGHGTDFSIDTSAGLQSIAGASLSCDTRYDTNEKIVITDDKFSTFDMLFASDIVISDYSCVIYEAGIRKLPIYLYAFDFDAYMKTRSTYMDYMAELGEFVYKDAEALAATLDRDFPANGKASDMPDTARTTSAGDIEEDNIIDPKDTPGYDADAEMTVIKKYVVTERKNETRNIAHFIFEHLK